jgi:hypothetical protein
MVYLLEFVGFLAVAIALAATPQLVKLFQRFMPHQPSDRPSNPARASSVASVKERSELRDEIRRLTHVLEMDGRVQRR